MNAQITVFPTSDGVANSSFQLPVYDALGLRTALILLATGRYSSSHAIFGEMGASKFAVMPQTVNSDILILNLCKHHETTI